MRAWRREQEAESSPEHEAGLELDVGDTLILKAQHQ